jgi:hypothetical protein
MWKYLLILLFGFGCYSQQIMPLRDKNLTKNVYFKDTFNDFDNFTGTWKYTSGTTELIITLNKQASYFNDISQSQEDIIYGEYKYIENGVEKINTLSNLFSVPADRYSHNIVGNRLIPACSTCPLNQWDLTLLFKDPTRRHIKGLSGRIFLKRVDSGGQQKLEMRLTSTGSIALVNGNPPEFDSFNIPWGTYVLVKQP